METTKFCQACGEGLIATAAVCPKCGTMTGVANKPATSGTNTLSTLAIVFSIVSVLFLPILFGPIALILGIIAAVRKEPRGTLALILSIVCPIMGFIFGFVFAAMMYGL